MRVRHLILLTIFFNCALAAPEQKEVPKEGTLFRYKGKVGDSKRTRSQYVLRMASELRGLPEPRTGKIEFTADGIYLHRILSVDPDGTLEIETVKEKGTATLTIDDQKKEQPDRPFKRVIRMTNRGKVLEEKIEGRPKAEEEESFGPIEWLEKLSEKTVENIAFPDKPIKVGDRWEEQITVTLTRRLKVPVLLKSVLKEFRTVDKRRVGVIETIVDAPFQTEDSRDGATMNLQARFTGTFTLLFDPEEGDEWEAQDDTRLVMEMVIDIPGKGSISQTHRVIARSRMTRLE
ncbi:MAG: hypothetical protein NZ959_12125 [Armatimonadetes bacterium]|nr:hypothetical protein [Armatimonadota bacterium]MDW8123009.1 hypothetical protein [Armatimonadota bacterium]